MDIDERFISAVKAADPNFWVTHASEFVTSTGLIPGFSKLLAESLMVPLNDPRTAFYANFKGVPLNYGSAWKENMIALPGTKRFNPKATAQDAFGYYENEGLQAVFETSYQGWTPLTVPSTLALGELINNPSRLGDFSNYILGNGRISVQMAIDAMLGKKLISTIEHTKPIDTSDFSVLRKTIRDVASDMRTNKGLYINAAVDPDKYLTSASRVIVLMEEKTYNDMVSDLAVLPSPDKIISNAEIITIPEMPTALTTDEMTVGVTANGWSMDTAPEFMDGGKPTAIVMSDKRLVYRPYKEESRMNVNPNGAGDFTNYHLLYKGCIGIRPWENAVAITTTPSG